MNELNTTIHIAAFWVMKSCSDLAEYCTTTRRYVVQDRRLNFHCHEKSQFSQKHHNKTL